MDITISTLRFIAEQSNTGTRKHNKRQSIRSKTDIKESRLLNQKRRQNTIFNNALGGRKGEPMTKPKREAITTTETKQMTL